MPDATSLLETNSPTSPAARRSRRQKRAAIGGTHLVTPRGLERRYGWSATTRWRAERDGRVPARDFYIGGVPAGWHVATLEASERQRAVT